MEVKLRATHRHLELFKATINVEITKEGTINEVTTKIIIEEGRIVDTEGINIITREGEAKNKTIEINLSRDGAVPKTLF